LIATSPKPPVSEDTSTSCVYDDDLLEFLYRLVPPVFIFLFSLVNSATFELLNGVNIVFEQLAGVTAGTAAPPPTEDS